MKIGVLAIQGDVPEQIASVAEVVGRGSVKRVRSVADLKPIDALLMPGGESTTIADLLHETRLWETLRVRIRDGLPVLATCAGMIVLATRLAPGPGGNDPPTMGLLDIDVRRNDYGTQRESFEAAVQVKGLPGGPFPGVFIRAPRILKLRGSTKAIATLDKQIVGVRKGAIVGLTFHPELSGDPRLLTWFLRETVGPVTRRTKAKRRAG